MTIIRSLTGLALTAALVSITPVAAQAEAGPAAQDTTAAPAAPAVQGDAQKTVRWGNRYAPGGKARTHGSLTVSGEDHADIPAAATGRISGKVYDLTRGPSCGWAVFRLTYRTPGGNLPFKHRSIVDCSYRTPKSFSFAQRDLYQVELKVCSGAKASKPSLNCLYAGSWKVLYVSR